ncbi:MAG: hypothetical protein ACRCUY_08685 [Thermoguttaceae bacterium]
MEEGQTVNTALACLLSGFYFVDFIKIVKLSGGLGRDICVPCGLLDVQ